MCDNDNEFDITKLSFLCFADKNGHLPSTCESAGVYIAKNMSEIF